MRLLAFDTSTAATIVAVADDDHVIVRRHDPQGRERPAHTTAALATPNPRRHRGRDS